LSNPQSWNRYSYTINNPIRYNDPSGHCIVEDDADSCGAHRHSDPLSSLLKASVAVVFGKLGQSDRNTFGLLGYGLEPGYSPAQGLATAINDNQLVTAEHVALGSPNATHMWIFVGRAYYIYEIGDLIIDTDTIPGDFATITLPGGLPPNVTPVPMANSYQAAPGQHVITIYTEPTLNEMDEITGFDLHALVTTTSNPAVDWVKGWGRQIMTTNPNVLDSGDSGGGVFYNNLLIGVNGDIQPDAGLATIAPSCFTGGGWSIIGGQYYDTPC